MVALWESGKLEEGVHRQSVYRRFAKICGEREFAMFEQWLDRYVRNWSHCDGVSGWLLAAAIGNRPRLIGRLAPWTKSKNRWKRRAAAVSLIQEAKAGRNTERIFEICTMLQRDTDDMLQKGVGWMLKRSVSEEAARGGRVPGRLACDRAAAAAAHSCGKDDCTGPQVAAYKVMLGGTHSLALNVREHFPHGLPAQWMAQIRRERRQRFEHEAALGHARMRDFELRRADDEISIEQDVDVDGARATEPGRAGGPFRVRSSACAPATASETAPFRLPRRRSRTSPGRAASCGSVS